MLNEAPESGLEPPTIRERISPPSPRSFDHRTSIGRALRERVPRSTHAAFSPSPNRSDPVDLLELQAAARLPELMPIRYARMARSPFAFLRGSAIMMAEDLSRTPITGLTVQACGDAHLANFGVFATPERNIVFDLNDFDETLPGPWEWDVKRLATSFVLSGRDRGFSATQSRAATGAMVRTYQRRMQEFAPMRYIDVWYSRIDAEAIGSIGGSGGKRIERDLAKGRTRDQLQAHEKLAETVDGLCRIKEDPPLLVRVREDGEETGSVRCALLDYQRMLDHDRRTLLARYEVVDIARKVVGVGSIGTRCYVVLMEGGDGDPLFMQMKEATASVLERHVRKSRYRNHGQRVVEGQRLTQAASDIFLGWTQGRGDDHGHFYWRQLRDAKASADLETIGPAGLAFYAEICGAALARAHARSGDPAMIAGYLGRGRGFPEAISEFAEIYADQVERDHSALLAAIEAGRIKAADDV